MESRGIYAMWNQPNAGSTDVLKAAHHRRSADLAEWLSRKPSRRTTPRKAFVREEFASLAFLAVALAGVAMLCSGLLALAFV
jgi:hypothetical protein